MFLRVLRALKRRPGGLGAAGTSGRLLSRAGTLRATAVGNATLHVSWFESSRVESSESSSVTRKVFAQLPYAPLPRAGGDFLLVRKGVQ